MNLSEGHKEYMKAIEALNEKGKAIRDNVEKHHTKVGSSLDEVVTALGMDDFECIQDYFVWLNRKDGKKDTGVGSTDFIELTEDNVNKPKHYEVLPGVEVYDIREAILSKNPHLHPCVADDWSRASEYLLRMFGKNGLEDAKKARWYLNKLIERMEENG